MIERGSGSAAGAGRERQTRHEYRATRPCETQSGADDGAHSVAAGSRILLSL